jgi:ubiquinone biosynthesis protein COQ9
MRTQILDAALKHVALHGWTTDALAAGADELGFVSSSTSVSSSSRLQRVAKLPILILSPLFLLPPPPPHSLPAASSGLFPSGAVELVWHIMRRATEDMSAALASTDLAREPVDSRIALGVNTRLASFAPYRRTWAGAMALGASPLALPETLRLLAVASDEIWWAAGDRSTDASWYSRRVLLMGLSAVAETFMLTDETQDLADTKAFVARRLEELGTASAATRDGASIAIAAVTGASAAATIIFDAFLRKSIVKSDGEGVGGVAAKCAAVPQFTDLLSTAKRIITEAGVVGETIKHRREGEEKVV